MDCLLGLIWVCKCFKTFSFQLHGGFSPDLHLTRGSAHAPGPRWGLGPRLPRLPLYATMAPSSCRSLEKFLLAPRSYWPPASQCRHRRQCCGSRSVSSESGALIRMTPGDDDDVSVLEWCPVACLSHQTYSLTAHASLTTDNCSPCVTPPLSTVFQMHSFPPSIIPSGSRSPHLPSPHRTAPVCLIAADVGLATAADNGSYFVTRDLRVIMAALRSRCGHYIFVLWFLVLSSSIFLFLA